MVSQIVDKFPRPITNGNFLEYKVERKMVNNCNRSEFCCYWPKMPLALLSHIAVFL